MPGPTPDLEVRSSKGRGAELPKASDGVALLDGAFLDDSRVDPAQVEGTTGRRVHEARRIAAEALEELRAARVGLFGHLDDGSTDAQARAGRQVVGREVDVDVELVAGFGPARPVTGEQGDRPGAHDRELTVDLRRAVVGVATASWQPVVADEALGVGELGGLDHLPLLGLGAPHDQLEDALVGRRTADVVEPGLELLGCAVVHRDMVADAPARGALVCAAADVRVTFGYGRPVPEHDVVIRGGTVVDGTGAEPRTADVAVSDGVITAVGRVDGTAARTVDADGLLVTPGFVDIHCHYDGQATWDDRLVPSTWHGVTTIVSGNCGVGFAPVRPADHNRLIELMEGVEDIPGTALHEGLSWTWQSFPEFLDAIEPRAFDADIAMQVPHAAVRLHVMGERGAAGEPATADDIVAMGVLARAGVEAGGLGFTTSRTRNHRTSRGEYTPTLRAEAAELIGIAAAMGESGRGVLQVVSDFVDPETEFAMLRRMVEQSGRPLSFSLVQSPLRAGGNGGWRQLLDLLERARADGLAITAQVAARGIGILLGLQCTLHPFRGNAVFAEIAGRSPADQARAMADPAFRERVLEADRGPDATGGFNRFLAWERVFELGDPPDYEPPPASSLAARAGADGVEPAALAYDVLAAGSGEGLLYSPIFNYADGDLGAVREMLTHPYSVVGLADGGAHVGTICDASFPTTLLAHWGRDRAEGQLPLPFLVQRQTRDTAHTVGLDDRGVLAPGYRADVNLIDLDRLAARRPVARRDLPAGGTRFVQAADGYVATVVAGEVTYENGEATGALPGRLVRGAQAAPNGAIR